MALPRNVGQELDGIQVLRAAAALMVVLHHSLEESNGALGRFSPDWFTTAGAAGVDIFFVISGFIMFHVSFRPGREPMKAGEFFFRRLTRIYPFYWLCCFAVLAISTVGLYANHHWTLWDIFASFALLPNANGLINVAWTLVYEIYFYLIFAAFLWWRSQIVSVIGVTAAIIGASLAANLLPAGTFRSFLTNPLPLEFCMGMWLAWGWRQLPRSNPMLGIASVTAVGLGFAMLTVAPIFVASPDTSGLPAAYRVMFWGMPAVIIVAAMLGMGRASNLMLRSGVLIGDASYALYLLHSFVMLAYAWLLKHSMIGTYGQLPVVVLVVLVSAAVAIAAHLLIERPLTAVFRQIHARPLTLRP